MKQKVEKQLDTERAKHATEAEQQRQARKRIESTLSQLESEQHVWQMTKDGEKTTRNQLHQAQRDLDAAPNLNPNPNPNTRHNVI